jgi:hypothetical protein
MYILGLGLNEPSYKDIASVAPVRKGTKNIGQQKLAGNENSLPLSIQ